MALSDYLKTQASLPPVLLHAMPGRAKTSFAVGAPNPFYFDIEGSLGPWAETVPHAKPKKFEEVMTMLTELVREDHPYKSVVIDTLDHLMPMIDAHICETESVADVRLLDKRDGFGSSGKAQAKQMLRVWNAAEALSKKGIWFIALAHSAIKIPDNPTGDSYPIIEPKLPKPVNAVCIEKARIVMHSERKVILKDADDGDRKIAAPADTTCYLITVPTGPVIAKNQYDIPSGTLRTSWESFITAYNTYMDKQKCKTTNTP